MTRRDALWSNIYELLNVVDSAARQSEDCNEAQVIRTKLELLRIQRLELAQKAVRYQNQVEAIDYEMTLLVNELPTDDDEPTAADNF